MTKAAIAKKLLKKKILPNKKILFDDDGDAINDVKERKSSLAQEYENEDVSGIDIEKAKLVLREEDKFDKQLFKEKVKAKHREEKRKLKEQKKKQEQEEQDDFGSEESEEEPDLSWLPDPDKIYGKKTEEELEQDELEMEKHHKIENFKGKKRKTVEEKPTKKKKAKLEHLGDSLNVNEAEELALMLLKN